MRATDRAPATKPQPSRLYGIVLISAAVVAGLDQITKQLALSSLSDGPVDVIDGVLTLNLTYNPGGAFGVLQGVPGFFLVATIGIVIAILFWVRNLEDRRWAIPLGMVLGGGVGNLIDRLFRGFDGRVVDFIDLHVWPVFNLADSAIVLGVAAMLVFVALSSSGAETESEP